MSAAEHGQSETQTLTRTLAAPRPASPPRRTATIEHRCESVSKCACVCVCTCVHKGEEVLGKSPYPPMPQFLYLYNGDNITYFKGLS